MQEPQCTQLALLLPAQRGQEQQAQKQARQSCVAQGVGQQPMCWEREGPCLPGKWPRPGVLGHRLLSIRATC